MTLFLTCRKEDDLQAPTPVIGVADRHDRTAGRFKFEHEINPLYTEPAIIDPHPLGANAGYVITYFWLVFRILTLLPDQDVWHGRSPLLL